VAKFIAQIAISEFCRQISQSVSGIEENTVAEMFVNKDKSG
jgi:hypothetical protein